MATGRGGFALIGVLWLVVLIAVIGLEFSLQARGITRRVANAADHSIAMAAAEGGLAYAQEALSQRLQSIERVPLGDGRLTDPWLEPGRFLTDTLEVGEAFVLVTLRDVGSMLNLNRIGEGELRALLAALRIDDGDADRIAQAVLDWRDVDDLRRARGAEREEYIEADAPVLPANGPFGSVDELRRVIGVTAEVYGRISPFLTVVGSGRVNPNSAPVEVLSALPGMSDELLAEILRRRRSGEPVTDVLSMTTGLTEGARESVRRALPTLMSRLTTGTEEVVVASEAWREGASTRAVARAVAVRVREAVFMTERSLR